MYSGATPRSIEPGLRESRDGERMRSLFAIGKLVHDGRQHICRVRNISDGGAGIRLHQPPKVGTPVTISLRGLPPTDADVRWVDGENAGLSFRRPMSTMHIGDDAGLTPRSPRFELDRAVRMRILDQSFEASALDISLGGIKLRTNVAMPVGAMADVMLAGETELLRGRLCWSSHAATGLRFLAPLPLTRLAAILA